MAISYTSILFYRRSWCFGLGGYYPSQSLPLSRPWSKLGVGLGCRVPTEAWIRKGCADGQWVCWVTQGGLWVFSRMTGARRGRSDVVLGQHQAAGDVFERNHLMNLWDVSRLGLHPVKVKTWNPKSWRFGSDDFPFPNRWFSGSMTCWCLLNGLLCGFLMSADLEQWKISCTSCFVCEFRGIQGTSRLTFQSPWRIHGTIVDLPRLIDPIKINPV